MKDVVITIDETTGELSFVHDQNVAEIVSHVGTVEKTRATHIYPVNWIMRAAFYVIRNRVDDSSWLAGFTRCWPCLWEARHIETNQIIGTDRDREQLIETEVAFLNARM